MRFLTVLTALFAVTNYYVPATAQEPASISARLDAYRKASQAFDEFVSNYSLASVTRETSIIQRSYDAAGADKKLAESEAYMTKALTMTGTPSALAAATIDGVGETSFTVDLLGQLNKSYRINSRGARSAPQATQAATEATAETIMLIAAQNQKLIEQNEQIISLLKQIAGKK